MISLGFHILLNDQKAVEKYKLLHKAVWPEIGGPGGALERIGIKKMRIFLAEPLKLFMYIEAIDGFNPEKDFSFAAENYPKVKEWGEMINNNLLVRLNPREGSLVWQEMEDIYHYENQ
jgi:L-rhamnose mutarotase